MNPTYLYHKTECSRIFDADSDDMQKLHDEGWRDTPAHPDFNDPPIEPTVGTSLAAETTAATGNTSGRGRRA